MKHIIILLVFLFFSFAVHSECPTRYDFYTDIEFWDDYGPKLVPIAFEGSYDSSLCYLACRSAFSNYRLEKVQMPCLANYYQMQVIDTFDSPFTGFREMLSSFYPYLACTKWINQNFSIVILREEHNGILSNVFELRSDYDNFTDVSNSIVFIDNYIVVGDDNNIRLYDLSYRTNDPDFIINVRADEIKADYAIDAIYATSYIDNEVNIIEFDQGIPTIIDSIDLVTNTYSVFISNENIWSISSNGIHIGQVNEVNQNWTSSQIPFGVIIPEEESIVFANDLFCAINSNIGMLIIDNELNVINVLSLSGSIIDVLHYSNLVNGFYCHSGDYDPLGFYIMHNLDYFDCVCDPNVSNIILGGLSDNPTQLTHVEDDTLTFIGWNVGYQNQFNDVQCVGSEGDGGGQWGYSRWWNSSGGNDTWYQLTAPYDCILSAFDNTHDYDITLHGFMSGELITYCDGNRVDIPLHSGSEILLSADGKAGGCWWYDGQYSGSWDYDPAGYYRLNIVVTSADLNVENESLINFSIGPAHPNPFNPITTLDINLSRNQFISIRVYDIIGQEVTELWHDNFPVGRSHITWNGTNHAEQTVASGVYLIKVEGDGWQETRKALLIR